MSKSINNPIAKYGNNRSFIWANEDGMMPASDEHWDTVKQNLNVLEDYRKLK